MKDIHPEIHIILDNFETMSQEAFIAADPSRNAFEIMEEKREEARKYGRKPKKRDD